MARVTVYFESVDVEVIAERPKIEVSSHQLRSLTCSLKNQNATQWYDLLSKIGGTGGFYLGMSVVTVIELVVAARFLLLGGGGANEERPVRRRRRKVDDDG